MSKAIDIYFRTTRSPEALEALFAEALRAELRVSGVAPGSSSPWTSFNSNDEDEVEETESAYGIRATVEASLGLPSGSGGAVQFRAAIRVAASEPDTDMLIVMEASPMMAIIGGVIYPAAGEREFFEEHVLAGAPMPVNWSAPRPWRS